MLMSRLRTDGNVKVEQYSAEAESSIEICFQRRQISVVPMSGTNGFTFVPIGTMSPAELPP